ncbi:MAG: ABC transporter permease, partial [Rhodoferax sp.]
MSSPILPSAPVTAAVPERAALKIEHPSVEALRMFLRNPSAIAGIVLLVIVLIVSIVGPWMMDADPFAISAAPFTPPFSSGAWLGTDYLGRDVFTALVYGGGSTLLVGAFAAVLSVLIGITLGAFAGYYGGKVDAVLMRITEFFQVLPALLFAMVVVALFTPT